MAGGFVIGRGFVEFGADDTQLVAALDNQEARLRSLADKFQPIARGAQVAFAGIAAAMGVSILKASDTQETMSQFEAVFKDQSAAAVAFSDTLADSIGRSRSETAGYMASLQDTFVPMGFAREEARLMSQQVTKLGFDLASFKNEADGATMERLQGALIGNHENVKKYGIIITEATLKQQLMNMGIEGGTKAATEQQKMMARLQIIMASSTDAQGDAARTAGNFANQQKRAVGILRNMADAYGAKFLPVAQAALTNLNDQASVLPGLIRDYGDLTVRLTLGGLALTGIVAGVPTVLTSLALLNKGYGVLLANMAAVRAGAVATGVTMLGAIAVPLVAISGLLAGFSLGRALDETFDLSTPVAKAGFQLELFAKKFVNTMTFLKKLPTMSGEDAFFGNLILASKNSKAERETALKIEALADSAGGNGKTLETNLADAWKGAQDGAADILSKLMIDNKFQDGKLGKIDMGEGGAGEGAGGGLKVPQIPASQARLQFVGLTEFARQLGQAGDDTARQQLDVQREMVDQQKKTNDHLANPKPPIAG